MRTTTLSSPRIWRIYVLEAKYEFLTLLRTPSFVLPSLLFPALFYTLFGVLLGSARGASGMAPYLLATYGVFGVMGAALFGLGVTTAIDRERGFLVLKRALPMPPGALLLARMIMAMLFASLISVILAILASTLAGVALAAWQWVSLFVINVLGALPFAALGLWLGTVLNGRAAPVVINIVYLPLSFLSGLWMPLTMMPGFIARIAPLWPSWHLGQIALKVVDHDSGGSLAMHVGVLALITALAFVLALRRLGARQ